LLKDHGTLPHALAAVLNYIDLPLDICEKIVESMISLVQRSNKWIDGNRFPNGRNPYVRNLIDDGVQSALPQIQQLHHNPDLRDLCLKLDKLLVASEEDVVQTANDVANVASAFGLPTIVEIKSKSNKRRVLRNLEDGDVRLIENAVGNLCI
jgi:hypothetical protein